MPTSAPPVREPTVAALAAAPAGAVVLDVREPGEYARGHVPGAVNLPQVELATRLAEVPRERPVYLVCQAGGRSRRAAQILMQVGFTNVASVAGGIAAWQAAGQPLHFDALVPR